MLDVRPSPPCVPFKIDVAFKITIGLKFNSDLLLNFGLVIFCPQTMSF